MESHSSSTRLHSESENKNVNERRHDSRKTEDSACHEMCFKFEGKVEEEEEKEGKRSSAMSLNFERLLKNLLSSCASASDSLQL